MRLEGETHVSTPDEAHPDDDDDILLPSMLGREAEPPINPELQRQIGQSLQAMYSDLLSQPVPDHLLDLVRRLHA